MGRGSRRGATVLISAEYNYIYLCIVAEIDKFMANLVRLFQPRSPPEEEEEVELADSCPFTSSVLFFSHCPPSRPSPSGGDETDNYRLWKTVSLCCVSERRNSPALRR